MSMNPDRVFHKMSSGRVGNIPTFRTPDDRYARMRNVWMLPTLPELILWMTRSGFIDIEILDKSITTTDEQRSTEWMTFESLAEALDTADPTRTVEGWPAPRRAIIAATNP